jgi:hypothetical protein
MAVLPARWQAVRWSTAPGGTGTTVEGYGVPNQEWMMKALERLTKSLGLVGALGVVACGLLLMRLPAQLGLDVWNLDKFLREIEIQKRREQELQAWGKVLFANLAAKQQIAREVASGRFNLLEGAARFRDLKESLSDFDRFSSCCTNPGSSEVEYHGRQVLGFVAETLEEDRDPGRASAILARLEAELQDYLDGKRQGREEGHNPCERRRVPGFDEER